MRHQRLTEDFVTSNGICITEGIGVIQISDQQGQVIDIPVQDARELRAWIRKEPLQGAEKP